MRRLDARLAEKNIKLTLSASALEFLAEKGYDPVYGARPLKRAIQQYVENPLSMEILNGNIIDGSQVSADIRNGKLVFNVA
jgi:ATP-dependent Clp protease ATP-binding subunit ClpB